MDQASSSQPSSTTNNPVVAAGRKVKSVLSTHQRPSVRIQLDSPTAPNTNRPPVSTANAEKPLPSLPSHETAPRQKSWFGSLRHRSASATRPPINGSGDSKADESYDDEYDPDTVDLLDIVGMFPQAGYATKD